VVTLNAEKQQKISELLKALPPTQAALMARAVAALRANGSVALPTDFILETLAPAVQVVRPDRSSLRHMICIPLEPFLTNDEQCDVSAGRIKRAMLQLWWDALTAVAGSEMTAFEAEHLGLPDGEPELDAFAVRARAAAARWTANLLTIDADAIPPAIVRPLIKNAESRLALIQIFEILKEAEPLTAAISAVVTAAERAGVALGGMIRDLPADVVNIAKNHYRILAASNVIVTRYFALAIMNRLERPWLIFRFTRALALQRDATIVANTEFGGIGARLVEDLERTAALVDIANPKGRMAADLVDFDGLRSLAERYVDCAEGVLTEIDLRRDSAWGEAVLRSRARMREALGEDRLRACEDAIRAVLVERLGQSSRNTGRGNAAEAYPTSVVVARADQAIRLLNFLSQRGGRQGFASAARKSLEGLIIEIEKCGENLIADLRSDPTDAVAQRLLSSTILLVAQLFPSERGEILTRRLRNAMKAAAQGSGVEDSQRGSVSSRAEITTSGR
jgi:hypothetical protein